VYKKEAAIIPAAPTNSALFMILLFDNYRTLNKLYFDISYILLKPIAPAKLSNIRAGNINLSSL
jgi:hypothetical protein